MTQPNLLLITTDQQRFDGMGLNGNPILRTPNLDSWAKRGVNFVRAYSPCASCIATRRSILTGQDPVTHGMVGYEDGVEFFPENTLPGLLGGAGYQTQLIGKFHMSPQLKTYGFDNLVLSETCSVRPGHPHFGVNFYGDWLKARGCEFPPNCMGIGSNSWIARPWTLDENLHQTSWCVHEAVDFLTRRRDPTRPWFLHLSFWAPHPPLIPPRVYWDRYIRKAPMSARIGEWVPKFESDHAPGLRPDTSTGPFRAEDVHEMMAGYYGLINHIDDRLSYLFAHTLGFYGQVTRRPTFVIFTSDHGEMLGDHQTFRKILPYEGSSHVPFFAFGVNGAEVARADSSELICHQDILPTLCELGGAEIPDAVDGVSLAPILRGEEMTTREDLFSEHSGTFANHFLVSGRHKYCWFAHTNEEQLFDLAADPHELRDLSGDAALLAPMRKKMATRLAGRTDYTYDVTKLKPLANCPPSGFWDIPLGDARVG